MDPETVTIGKGVYDELRAEVDRLRVALEAIVMHQEAIGGGIAVLSATRRIAQEALEGV